MHCERPGVGVRGDDVSGAEGTPLSLGMKGFRWEARLMPAEMDRITLNRIIIFLLQNTSQSIANRIDPIRPGRRRPPEGRMAKSIIY